MRFEVTQRFEAAIADVADALTDPAYYELLAESPKLGAPEVLDRVVDGDEVRLRIRYRFAGDLSSAARAVLDPDKLTWVEESTHDQAAHSGVWLIRPDNYADRFKANGGFALSVAADDDGATVRTATGEVKVRAPLVASTVERAIISGLEEHLRDEVAILNRFVNG